MARSDKITLLFLIADTGSGHRVSANAVAQQLQQDYPDQFTIALRNPLLNNDFSVLEKLTNFYQPLTLRVSWVWEMLWKGSNSPRMVSFLNALFLRQLRPKIQSLLETLQPSLVVSFHPLLNHVTAEVLGERSPKPALITVVTDLVNIHASWYCTEASALVLPSTAAVQRAQKLGLAKARCFDFGLPVNPSFCQEFSSANRSDLRQQLGLSAQSFVVLLAGGTENKRVLGQYIQDLINLSPNFEIVVICGHNQGLKTHLQRLYGDQKSVHIQDFIDNMASFMRAADVLVGKAGPGIIAEALCCALPILLTSYIPGQETGNVDFVVQNKIGQYVPKQEKLFSSLEKLSRPNSLMLATHRNAAQRCARPGATHQIAQLIAERALDTALPSNATGAGLPPSGIYPKMPPNANDAKSPLLPEAFAEDMS